MIKPGLDCLGRRAFLSVAMDSFGMAAFSGCTTLKKGSRSESRAGRKVLIGSQGHIGIIDDDGTGLEYLSLESPGDKGWVPGPDFPDSRRMLVSSYGEGKMHTGEVRMNRWIFDLDTRELEQIPAKVDIAPSIFPSHILPGGERMIAQAVIEGASRIFNMKLDCSDAQSLTPPKEGFPYFPKLSPDGTRMSYHSPGLPFSDENYRIFVVNLDGTNRRQIIGDHDHLYFAPMWSPDGEWLSFLDCHDKTDPGHDWADLCVARPDGSDFRKLTEGQSYWFAAAHGNPDIPETRASGSNIQKWTPDGGQVTHTRKAPGSQPAWKWATDQEDVDHFNRRFTPEEERGGTQICLLDHTTGAITELTEAVEHRWDWNALFSPDGGKIVFNRARMGEAAALWVMDSDGGNQRLLTRGVDDKGVYATRYLPF